MSRTVAFLGACLMALALVPAAAGAARVTLQWDANTEPDLAGYRIHFGTSSGSYTNTSTAGNVTTFPVDNLTAGQYYCFAATAYDTYGNESGYSNEVCATAPGGAESVSTPQAPAGPAAGSTGASQAYTAAGAASSAGDPVQYRFLWGDGTDSGWLPAGTAQAARSWNFAGTYAVAVEARCATHTSVVSAASAALQVTITGAPQETVAAPTAPGGPTSGSVGVAAVFDVAGASSSLGHALEYRFHWGDGTDSGWLGTGTASASKSWSFAATFSVRAEARCATHTSAVSPLSPSRPITIAQGTSEWLSAPTAPGGPASGTTGLGYVFSTGGAVASSGDEVQYRIHWGDGTASPWSAPGASAPCRLLKFWLLPGVYTMWAEARCSRHTDVRSVSTRVAVTIRRRASRLFADRFGHGGSRVDPDWRVISGTWRLGGGRYQATSVARRNLAVTRNLSRFVSGRLQTAIMPTGILRSLPGGGIVFAYRDPRHYRYAAIVGSRLVIGQIGSTAKEKAGLKAAARKTFALRRWHRLRVDVRPNGAVTVMVGTSTRPVVRYRFQDQVAGRVGFVAARSRVLFDNFNVWDARILP